MPAVPAGSAPSTPPRSTLGNVAALARVSPKTASRVLNGHDGVAQETRDRVIEAAKMLNFRPNGLARELRTGAVSRAVGLVIADLSNPFFCAMAAAVEAAVRARGLELFIASTNEDGEREAEVITTLLERRVRALLVVPASNDHSYLYLERSLGTPIVFLDRPPRNLSTDSVLGDDRRAAQRGATALLDAGHTRIAVIADEQTAWTARERLAGARAALAGPNHPGWEELVATGAHDAELARAATLELLDRPEPPTAFFALNNLMMHGVLLALRDTGRTASVLGFDESDLTDVLGVSTIALDPEELGTRAITLALERLDGHEGEPQDLVLEPRMAIRTPLDQPIRMVPAPG